MNFLPGVVFATFVSVLFSSGGVNAKEYYIGGPVKQNDMEIVANYLIGVEMFPMQTGMQHGPDVIHVEADVHALADNSNGFGDGVWIPYLSIGYTLTKGGGEWKSSGVLKPMEAKDGPHYAIDVKMPGPGDYKLVYSFAPPAGAAFARHVDKETGVPEWWKPFTTEFIFHYPSTQ